MHVILLNYLFLAVYCYKCDDDIKDPDLHKHLLQFGIKAEEQVKTEKNVTELNIDVNINFHLSKALEEGKVLKNVYGPGFTGLENLGNSCYMNAVLQILISLEPFQSRFYDSALEHLSTCSSNPYDCYDCQMHKISFGLLSGVYSKQQNRTLIKVDDKDPENEDYQDGIRPTSFKSFFGRGSDEFLSNRQQDAYEYLNFLLDKIETEELKKGNKNLKNIFAFDHLTKLSCTGCKGYKLKKERNYSLTFSIPDWKEKRDKSQDCLIEECIKLWLSNESVELDCPNCKHKTLFIKSQRIQNFPSYLIIVYQKFVYDWVPFKLDINLKINYDSIDFSSLSEPFDALDEEILIAEEISTTVSKKLNIPKFNEASLNNMISLGIPELAAKNSLLKNNQDEFQAIEWYFNNMEDSSLKKPIEEPKQSKFEVNSASLDELQNFGFTSVQAAGALIKFKNNLEQACDFLFGNPDFNFEQIVKDNNKTDETSCQVIEEINQEGSPKFSLLGFITHLGKNTSSGHYVCNAKKENNWYYYNDSKVCSSIDPPIEKGYIYFFKNSKN